MFELILSIWRSVYSGLFTVLFILINFMLFVHFVKRLFNFFFDLGEKGNGYVLVTGCDSGFGYGTALELNKRSIYVFAGCLTPEGVERLNGDSNFRGKAFILDITKKEDINNAREIITEEVKENGLWCVVNNAGVLRAGPIEWISVEDMKISMDVNLWGAVNVTKQMISLIKETRGRVVNITSMFGRMTLEHTASYSMSKYALEAFSDCLRHEMKPWGVSVHIIEPGCFRTPMQSIPNHERRWKEIWDTQPKQMQRDYGEEYYKSCVVGATNGSEKYASPNTKIVIDAVCHAVLSSNPKLRYAVGLDANTVWMVIATLPTAMGDFIGNLIVKPYIPAAMKM